MHKNSPGQPYEKDVNLYKNIDIIWVLEQYFKNKSHIKIINNKDKIISEI